MTLQKQPSRLVSYFRHSAEPTQAAALTLPLLCLYGLGVLIVPSARNGVDFVSSALYVAFSSLGPMRAFAYLAFYGLLIGANVGLIAYLSSKNQFHIRYFWPLIAESALYAFATGTATASLTAQLVNAIHAVPALGPVELSAQIAGGFPAQFTGTFPALAASRQLGLVDGIFVSAGAGLHEELVFRLVGIGAVARVWLGKDWRKPSLHLLAIVVVSSVLFSAVHHIVEPFVFTVFVFRVIAGLFFAALFLLRGFAVAAWTHFLYDVWVIVLLGA